MANRSGHVVLQRQDEFNVGDILNPHFGNLSYLLQPLPGETAQTSSYKSYSDNESLWRDVQSGILTGYSPILLKSFDLFQWIPRSPGLYYTESAKYSRNEAMGHLDRNFEAAPIRCIDHAWELNEGEVGERQDWDYTLVFAPKGKQSMLDGGIGCVRLKPVIINDQPLWLMSASSDGIAHKGFPLAVPIQLHSLYNERIIKEGALACNIRGHLMFLPHPFTQLFDSPFDNYLQPLYLQVEDIEPLEFDSGLRPREVSGAVSFVSDYKGYADIYASYVTFSPKGHTSYKRAVSWLKSEYVESHYGGRIITDFDQTKMAFPGAALSLRKIMSRELKKGELEESLELMHAQARVDQFFDELDRRELLRNLGGQTRNSVFISYSHNERDTVWLDRVRIHLKAVLHDHDVHIWDDGQIPTGSHWDEEIKMALASTRVAVLILSADYLASDYIRSHELPKFLFIAQNEGAKIMGLIGSACSFTGSVSSLQDLEFANKMSRPLDQIRSDEQEQIFNKLAVEVARVFDYQ